MKKILVALVVMSVLMASAATVPLLPKKKPPKTPPPFRGPSELRVDDLKTPVGIDDATPRFSWQLVDPTQGAKQSAYQILVASSSEAINQGKGDIWDSGHIASDASLNVRYAGPEIKPSSRYFWRVRLWDATGKPYSEGPSSWWEVGLMHQEAWKGQWIGYETPEEDAVRHAQAAWIASPDAAELDAERGTEQHIAFREVVTLPKAVRRAALYATGQDTVSAWVNGEMVLTAEPLPAWKHMPWKKFQRADASGKLNVGTNTIAVETVHYLSNPDGTATDIAPMIATLAVEYTDGTTAAFGSGTDWKTAIHAAGWHEEGFDDSGWKTAVAYAPPPDHKDDAPLGHPWIPDSVKELRRSFEVTSPVKSAQLYATALGAYELFLNGKRVGDDALAPGWTDYREHVKYQTHDVTEQVVSGKNVIGALLAPGWYETPLEWLQQPNNYGDTPPALKAQLRIEHVDGSVEWVTTDTNWQASTSEILHSEIYDGETQDARQKQTGWDTGTFDAASWKSAISIDPKPVTIEAQDFQPIRVEHTLEAKAVTEPKPGIYVFDFGQNFAGVEKVRVQGPAGTNVRLRFAEIANADGTIYTDNLRTAKATDHFILSGNGVEEFTPRFTFHGFRYVELTGLPTAPSQDAVSGLVFHTDAPFTVKLQTDNPMLDKLWNNILWGQRSNFVGIPTDCPQRDERLGWMGDAEVFWRAAAYNMDLAAFSRKFGGDMRGTQVGSPYYGIYSPGTVTPNSGHAAGWSDAGVIIPWTSWMQTGDTSIIDQNWPAMVKYLNAIEGSNPDGLWVHDSGIAFGDWLSPEGKTDYPLIATAYWALDVSLMRQMAHATGRTQDEQMYAQLFEKIRAAFDKKFLHDDGFVAGADSTPPQNDGATSDAASHAGDTQTGYVLALHMNLVPGMMRGMAAQKLVDKIDANHGLLGTGFLGTPYLLEELTKTGHAKLAYNLLLNTQYPSWGYLVDHGATTMWERWNGDQMKSDPSMNSYNHYAYGAVADWIYRYAAGVDTSPLGAGFHTVVLHPMFDPRMGHLVFDYASPYGPIHSDWRMAGTAVEWHITLPGNTTGWLKLTPGEAEKYKVEGTPLAQSRFAKAQTRDGESGYELGAGTYNFQVSVDQ